MTSRRRWEREPDLHDDWLITPDPEARTVGTVSLRQSAAEGGHRNRRRVPPFGAASRHGGAPTAG